MRQPPGRAHRRGGGERKPREERWSELIEVATDVFYAKGYDAASLQDSADRLGMLKGSLYYYIRSKEDLLFDVIKAVHEEGLANIKSLAAGEGPFPWPGRRAGGAARSGPGGGIWPGRGHGA